MSLRTIADIDYMKREISGSVTDFCKSCPKFFVNAVHNSTILLSRKK